MLYIPCLEAQTDIAFSEERGYHETSFSLILSSNDENALIYYTTDFTKPSSTNGNVYAEP